VIDNLIAAAGDRRTAYYFRTADGAEVDLLFERGGKIEVAIEVKRSTAPKPSRGFRSARQALDLPESYLVHPGSDTWTVEPGVTASSLRDLMSRLTAT
jgi:predicted AAA+ superfamily ATPase